MSPTYIAAIPCCIFEVGVSWDETLQSLVITSQGEVPKVSAVSLGLESSEMQHTKEKYRSEILPSILETAHTLPTIPLNRTKDRASMSFMLVEGMVEARAMVLFPREPCG